MRSASRQPTKRSRRLRSRDRQPRAACRRRTTVEQAPRPAASAARIAGRRAAPQADTDAPPRNTSSRTPAVFVIDDPQERRSQIMWPRWFTRRGGDRNQETGSRNAAAGLERGLAAGARRRSCGRVAEVEQAGIRDLREITTFARVLFRSTVCSSAPVVRTRISLMAGSPRSRVTTRSRQRDVTGAGRFGSTGGGPSRQPDHRASRLGHVATGKLSSTPPSTSRRCRQGWGREPRNRQLIQLLNSFLAVHDQSGAREVGAHAK